jgi:hypothetical protein
MPESKRLHSGCYRLQLAKTFGSYLMDKRGKQVFRPYMRDEEFQKVKLQLRTLGLIGELRDKSTSGGNSALWTLTTYGDRLLTQVGAIRSCTTA